MQESLSGRSLATGVRSRSLGFGRWRGRGVRLGRRHTHGGGQWRLHGCLLSWVQRALSSARDVIPGVAHNALVPTIQIGARAMLVLGMVGATAGEAPIRQLSSRLLHVHNDRGRRIYRSLRPPTELPKV